jgi:acetyl esterase/lipase
MERLSVWVSAGLLSAGVSAAVLAGAGVAVADDSPSGSGPGSASDTPSASGPAADSKPDTKPDTKPETEPDIKPGPEDDAVKPDEPETVPSPGKTPDVTEPETGTITETPKKKKKHTEVAEVASAVTADIEPAPSGAPEPQVVEVAEPSVTPDPVVSAAALADISAKKSATQRISQPTVSLALAAPEAAAPVQAAVGPAPSLFRWIAGVTSSIVNGIGSLAFNSLQALEALVTGPPVLPPNSTVTVRSSTILLSTGQRVKANWYYPDGDEVPDKLIVLQHGFFALGPMYSHTAADLAASTGAIVVTPTISSNPFAGDDNWINGEGLASAIADLFVGERTALNDSARAAGFVTRYGVDAELPEKFALAGHSAGAGLVVGVAGYLVDKNAADDLVGVITLDGVPLGSAAAVALGKLQTYEQSVGGRYIPIREIGAPSNAFNSISTLRAELNEARPGRFNGVVLNGGVHMDSMRGGNPVIQFAAYLIAGFPQSKNQAAVSLLATTWFNDWFNDDTDNGDLLTPGSTIPIGAAQGVVIGRALAPAVRFVTVAV